MEIYGLILLILDGIFWGLAGYTLFRLFGGYRSRWYIGALATFVIYFIWDEIIAGSIANLFQANLNTSITIDIWDFLISFAVIILGFYIGMRLFDKAAAR
ncbi:hypothetical protein GF357_01880 [Candidatus Dojkabacteria bacterium]|nr:hypothetical protein [Candidatus Dojkabacteria bacterium]